jgi:hypothetical protein
MRRSSTNFFNSLLSACSSNGDKNHKNGLLRVDAILTFLSSIGNGRRYDYLSNDIKTALCMQQLTSRVHFFDDAEFKRVCGWQSSLAVHSSDFFLLIQTADLSGHGNCT